MLILSNFPLLIKRLLGVAGILFFISLLIIWVLIYIIPVKISFISVPLNYLSAILFAISLSSIEVIFFLLGFITFKNKTSINTKKINNNEAQNKSLNKLIIILLSVAMILSVFIDYFASLGFIK
jgi:signal transduction histidine kinase